MEIKNFIEFKLNEIKGQEVNLNFKNNLELVEFIYKTIMSKKFRKFSIISEYLIYIRECISESIEKSEPIKFVLPFGGYKLWSLKESPETDWAELFTLMYYAKWLKPILEVYKPGVVFDFASDDVVLEKMNNIPKSDTESYRKSFERLVVFLEGYIPENLKFTFTSIGSFYSKEEFEKDLQDKIEKTQASLDGLPVLDEKKKAAIDMNVKLNPGQDNDPLWREKVELIHQAYYTVDKRRPYSREKGKILVFPFGLKDGKCLGVGTTKTSVAKFWVGVGVLKKVSEKFVEYVLSPRQLGQAFFKVERINIDGLEGKNFSEIRVLEK